MFLISRVYYKNLHGQLLSIFGMWYLKVDSPENILKRGRISFPKIDLCEAKYQKAYISFKKVHKLCASKLCMYQICCGNQTKTYLLVNGYNFRCASHVSPECNLGVNRVHILPPVAICPIVLDRQHSVSKEKLSQRSKNSHDDRDAQAVLVSFFITFHQQHFPFEATQIVLKELWQQHLKRER